MKHNGIARFLGTGWKPDDNSWFIVLQHAKYVSMKKSKNNPLEAEHDDNMRMTDLCNLIIHNGLIILTMSSCYSMKMRYDMFYGKRTILCT